MSAVSESGTEERFWSRMLSDKERFRAFKQRHAMHSSYVATLVHKREKEREKLWASLRPIEPRPRSGKIEDPSKREIQGLSFLFPCSNLVFNDDPKSRCVSWAWRSLKDISRRIMMIVNKRLRENVGILIKLFGLVFVCSVLWKISTDHRAIMGTVLG